MIHIRKATEQDVVAIHDLVRELAIYEKAEHEVATSPEIYARDGFGATPYFECFVAEHAEDGIVGISLFYFGYSTWKGKLLYLDDLVIRESHRRMGIGTMLMKNLAKYAIEQQATMMKWQVLDWNEPAIEMYRQLGAVFDSEWVDCKMFHQQLNDWVNEG
ncbi:MAG: GNAT family N-acetyltransferase [Bacteroidota bacterium]